MFKFDDDSYDDDCEDEEAVAQESANKRTRSIDAQPFNLNQKKKT
jgi:hypothetical protein